MLKTISNTLPMLI